MISQVPQCQVVFPSSNAICLWVKSSQTVSVTFNARKEDTFVPRMTHLTSLPPYIIPYFYLKHLSQADTDHLMDEATPFRLLQREL